MADPTKGISMHRTPFLNSENLIQRDKGKNGSPSSWQWGRTGSLGQHLHFNYFGFFQPHTSSKHEPHTCGTITTTNSIWGDDRLWHCPIQETQKTRGGKNYKRIPWTNAVPQSLPMIYKRNKSYTDWCRPRMPHFVMNWHFIANLLPIMPYTNRTQTLLFSCRRNINFCLIRTLNRQTLHIVLDTLQRGRFSVLFRLGNETIIEVWQNWNLCVPFNSRWYRSGRSSF